MPATQKFAIIQEMLDEARRSGRFETASKLQRALCKRDLERLL